MDSGRAAEDAANRGLIPLNEQHGLGKPGREAQKRGDDLSIGALVKAKAVAGSAILAMDREADARNLSRHSATSRGAHRVGSANNRRGG
jgi:hypothetical protein